jgi:uncharacterized repeat protein (TIGR02543 family)
MKKHMILATIILLATITLSGCSIYERFTARSFVYFETYHAEPIERLRVAPGETLDLPELESSGYEFSGWYTDETFENMFTEDTEIYEDTYLYAKWDPILYELTIVNGSDSDTFDYYYDTVIDPADFLIEGYDLVAFSTDASHETPFELERMPARDLTIYVRYERASFSITLKDPSGETLDTLSFIYEDPIELTEFTRTGYAFAGWFHDPDLETPFTDDFMPARDLTLYGSFQPLPYDIHFEMGIADQKEALTFRYLDPISIEDPMHEGYAFQGWFLDADFVEPFTTTRMPSNDLTLYAKWSPKDYVITFETGSEDTMPPIVVTYLSPIAIDDTPAKTGHSFVDWWEDPDYEIPFERDVMPAHDLTLYARYARNTYVLTRSVDPHPEVDPIEILYDDPIELSDMELFGHTFQGWFSDETYQTPFELERMPARDLTVYGHFIANSYTLSYYREQGIAKTALGSNYTLILTEDSHVLAVGRNTYGQLGNNSNENLITPTDITHFFELAEQETITDLVAGVFHSVALSSSGRVFTFGNNIYGQLGNGSTFPENIPIDITSRFDLSPTETIVGIEAGPHHNIAYTSSNRIFSWGLNNTYQLGTGTNEAVVVPQDITAALALDTDETIVLMSLSMYHTMILTSDHNVYAFGRNEANELFLEGQDHVVVPTNVIGSIPLNEGEEIILLDSGLNYTLLWTSEHRLIAVGNNDFGQLATTENTDYPVDITALIPLVGDETIATIAAHDTSTILATTNNRVFVFGTNGFGQLGDGTKLTHFQPQETTMHYPLSTDESIVKITISQTHTAIITSTQRLLTFGNNDYQQLGTNQVGTIKEPWFYRLYDEMQVGYDEIMDLSAPEQEGFVFSGWYQDPALTDPWIDERMPERDVILYGRFMVE